MPAAPAAAAPAAAAEETEAVRQSQFSQGLRDGI